jgi:hypothetical protein
MSDSGDTPQRKFRCPYDPDDDGIIGHRSPHCHVNSSPLRGTSHILRVAETVKDAAHEQGRPQ